jgi:hypothetical protein
MFAREVGPRLLAVRGFLYIIIQQLRAAPAGAPQEPSCSQASSSQVGAAGGSPRLQLAAPAQPAVHHARHLRAAELPEPPAGRPGFLSSAPAPPRPAPQASLSQMQALSPAAGANLLHELLGFLRKSLGQQAAVRAALYSGLRELLAADPGCCQVGRSGASGWMLCWHTRLLLTLPACCSVAG